MPLWLKDLGYPIFTISLLTSIQAWTRLFAPYGWGWLSDITGERVRILRYSSVMALLCSLGLLVTGGDATHVLALVAVLVLMFVHTSSIVPMSEAAMAHVVSPGGQLNAKRYGRIRLWGSVGFLVTVFATGWWFERYSIAHFPQWTIATLFLLMCAIWCLPKTQEPKDSLQNPFALSLSKGKCLICMDFDKLSPNGIRVMQRFPKHSTSTSMEERSVAQRIWPIVQRAEVRWFFVSQYFHVLAHMSIYIFLSLYLDELHYSKTFIGMMWALSIVMEITWFYTQGRWIPKLSLHLWLVVTAVACALRMGLMAGAAQYLLTLLLCQALHALTFTAHHTACIALISHHFPGQLRGRGQALFAIIGYGLTGVTAGFVGGWLSTHMDLAAVFWAAMISALLAAGAAWRASVLSKAHLNFNA